MRTRILGLGLVGLLGAGVAFAQPVRRPAAGREEAWKVIDAYVVSNLQESLGLSDEQFTKLLPLVRKLQKDRRELNQRRRQTLMEIKKTLASGTATEAAVAEQLKALKAIEVEEPAAIRKNVDAVDAALTPLQQARFRVLEIEIQARIRQLTAQAREQRRQNRNGKRVPPAADEDPLEP